MYDMIAQQMNASLPFVAHNGIRVTRIADGEGEAVFPQTGQSLNHIGTQHAGGLFTLGETASGAAMTGAFAPMILNVLPLAAEASIRYLAVAKGDITAMARVEGEPTDLRAAIEADGVARFPVKVTLADMDGATVAEMTVRWNVRKKGG
ncbi:MAG: DUF4442 domain-containing protein [Pseudomonadota bacterium]